VNALILLIFLAALRSGSFVIVHDAATQVIFYIRTVPLTFRTGLDVGAKFDSAVEKFAVQAAYSWIEANSP
jgi:hypothetical protein